MKVKKRISFCDNVVDLNKEIIRENARMTPEECWNAFIKLRRLYYGLTTPPEKLRKQITISKTAWT